MRKLGFHINNYDVAVKSGWVEKFSSSAVHVLLSGGVGDEIVHAQQLATMCPNSLIVYRPWSVFSPGDSDHFEYYLKDHGTSALPMINTFRSTLSLLPNKNITFQVFNETADGELWPQFIEFNVNFVIEMNKLGRSACLLGTGPGRPSGTREEIFQKWKQAAPLFDLINKSPIQHYINTHSYFGYPIKNFTPFLFGRFTYLLEDLAKLGLLTNKIKIIIGECGWADPAILGPYPPNPANGYRGFILKGVSPEALADDLVSAAKMLYEPNEHLVGAALFCLDKIDSWPDFNLLNEPSILERIYSKMDTWILVPTPETNFKVIADVLNVRFAPTLTGQVISQKHNGDVIKTNGYVDFDGFRWRQLTNSEGYCAEVNLTDSTMRFLQEVTDWKKQIIDLIDHIQTELEEVETLIGGV